MSRVDEALRRSSGALGKTTTVEVAEPTAIAASIDRYAPEAGERYAPEVGPRTVEFPKARTPAFEPAPRIKERVSPTFSEALRGRLVIDPDTLPVSVEQYRRVAAALHEYQQQHDLKTVMVSSAVPKEGKTLTALNVALTLSQSYHNRVLLIDADLRRPSIQQSFGLPDGRGLGDVLAAGGGPLPLVEVAPGLSVLPAGKPNKDAVGLLTAAYLRTLIAEAAAQYDWVLIDTPPVGALPDARLISNLVDGVLFVIDAQSTPYDLVKRAIGELGPERIVGTVLNRIEPRSLPVNDYYGYYTTRSA
jgi:capsular exopolysaccharide synthesis family protein